jgi:hypothetical protein
MTALSLLLLLIPVGFHLWQDRRGEKPKEKAADIFMVSGIALLCSVAGYRLSAKPIIDGLLLAWALHFLLFDYLIVIILKKRGGSSYTDDVLRQFSPWQRLILKIGVLGVATLVYVS